MTYSRFQIETLVVGSLQSNCYILWDNNLKQGAIIDPGHDSDIILRVINKIGIEIKYILATHGHFDHIGAVAPIQKALNVEFLAHKDDYFFIEDCKNAAHRWGIEIDQPSKPDRFIQDGDTINLGDFGLEVLHTPGHSPGSISFLHNSMVFVGDTLFQNSIGRTDFKKGSFELLSRSIKTRLYILPDNTLVYTGHGPITTIGNEKKYNPFLRIPDYG
jgi:glyoxylase-like metal-dependent hydrolase (beta-lactamase superfamily II)